MKIDKMSIALALDEQSDFGLDFWKSINLPTPVDFDFHLNMEQIQKLEYTVKMLKSVFPSAYLDEFRISQVNQDWFADFGKAEDGKFEQADLLEKGSIRGLAGFPMFAGAGIPGEAVKKKPYNPLKYSFSITYKVIQTLSKEDIGFVLNSSNSDEAMADSNRSNIYLNETLTKIIKGALF